MTRFVVGQDRSQSTLFPECLEDYLSEDNPVRAIDVFVDELDLARLNFGFAENHQVLADLSKRWEQHQR
jgi:transposase